MRYKHQDQEIFEPETILPFWLLIEAQRLDGVEH
jgi:hypothetical protein